MRKLLPWYLKIAIKVVLARLPLSYDAWARLNLFKHGQMETATYARKIFDFHRAEAKTHIKKNEAVFLEMGPGDSVAGAMLARSAGAKQSYLVDVGAFATKETPYYQKLANDLIDDGYSVPVITDDASFDDILRLYNASYLTEGQESLKTIEDNHVDFIWSHATMEHVRKYEFADIMAEAFRILKPGGICSHNVDFKDHLGGALNNLRIKEKTWEADWMVNSGFYTNRIRYDEMLDLMKGAGFIVESLDTGRWDEIPTAREKMVAPFNNMSDDSLLVRGMHVILRKPD